LADCLNCKNCKRQETYDGEWGMFIFTRICLAGVSVVKNGRVNPWDMICDKFEHGEPKIVFLTEKQKRKFEG
jgi:hypothetical protein